MVASPFYRASVIALVVAGAALPGCGLDQTELAVQVVNGDTGAPIQTATVSVDGFKNARTNMLGVARLLLRPGAYAVDVSAPRYETRTATITLFAGSPSSVRVSLLPAAPGPSPSPGASPAPGASPSPGASTAPGASPAPSATPEGSVSLYGRVTDPTGARLPNVTIFVGSDLGLPYGLPAVTNVQGEYKLTARVPKGASVKVSAMADGYQTRTRYVQPSGSWRMDFANHNALEPLTAQPGGPNFVTVEGKVEDTKARAIAFGVLKVESDDVRYPFNLSTVIKDGHYKITVPGQISLRFTASAQSHRPVTFLQAIKTTDDRIQDFTGYRGLAVTLMGAEMLGL